MRRHQSTVPWFLIGSALFVLSLRPLAPVERVVDVAVAPLRVVAELAFPFVLARQQRVQAAERRQAEAAPREAAENERLLADLARSALPTDPRLLEGRRIVHAEVLGRETDRDHLRVRLRDPRGVEVGLPVAFGDVYVGRVAEAPDAGGEAVVELVTAAGFHVGARARFEDEHGAPLDEPSEVLLTVGGVRSRPGERGQRRAEIRLAAHHPSDRALLGGRVRVHELFDDPGDFALLSEGLVLGELCGSELSEPWVAPEIDYLDGLFQVVVLCPPQPELPSALPFETVLRDANWVRTRPLGVGDPSPERSACKIRLGQLDGVIPGAAVTSVGAKLVGRVLHAGLLSSDVAFLDDPGFSVVAVARFEGLDEPRVLGRLDALGRDEASGRLLFRWTVRVSLDSVPDDGRGGCVARLFSGSGDAGLSAGFGFGQAWIPLDAVPGQQRLIEVRPDVQTRDVYALFVHTLGAAEGGP